MKRKNIIHIEISGEKRKFKIWAEGHKQVIYDHLKYWLAWCALIIALYEIYIIWAKK